MKLKTLIAVAVAGAFALPLAAQASADGDRMILAQAGGPAGATTGTYHRLDANRDGFVSREEAAAARGLSFSELDKDNDGKLSAAELRAWRDPMGASPGEAAAGSGSTTGTTAGPGEASPRTGPGSDTATTPSTSGTGKAK